VSLLTETCNKKLAALAICMAAASLPAGISAAAPSFYTQHNLVSDGFIPADHTDPQLVNAWGIAFNPTGVWWVNAAESGISALYDKNGVVSPMLPFANIPGANDVPNGANPTGIVFSGGMDFVVSDGTSSGPARFMFASEDGTISAWSPVVPPPPPSHQAHVVINDSDEGANYKGLALASTPDGDRLYATDFHNNRIEVYDGNFDDADITGDFHDSQIPDGFAPFGIAAINGKIYVTFAKQDADAEDDVAGAHLGYIDVFDTDGHLLKRLVKKGKLNAPWGMALAPSNFGKFSNMLLVGNFGDGRIHAYDPNTGKFKGTMRSAPGHPIEIQGLWGLGFGNGGDAGPTNTLFFAAGPGGEEHGLFGSLTLITNSGDEDEDGGNGDD
jgi:uncharacterized protein (TIGR03118 family)